MSALRSHASVAYNFGTGDTDPDDGLHQTFDNQYPLNHAYYGYMDFFSLQNMHNIEVVTKTKLFKALSARIAYQSFWLQQEDTDAWYNAGGGVVRQATGNVSPYVGSEIDVTLGMKLMQGKFTVNAGYGHFFADDYVRQTGSRRDADFVFMQTKFAL